MLSEKAHAMGAPVAAPHQVCDVAVVGAGPYGLSAAAHLRGRGLRVAIFGTPMGFWREHMPRGMLLRSPRWATDLSDPHNAYTLGRYLAEVGQAVADPLPAETITAYGEWFQRQVVPDVDEVYVERVTQSGRMFTLALADGRQVTSGAVIIALGLQYFAYRPTELTHLPPALVSHTLDHADLAPFAGQRVLVVGGGQSAVETAAIAHERGARVQLVTRRSIRWLREEGARPRTLLQRLLNPIGGIGSGWHSVGMERLPYAFQRLPRALKDRLLPLYGPAAASWLEPRIVGKVPVREGQPIRDLREDGGEAVATLADGTILRADHVILATGYRVDLTRLPLLDPDLRARIRTFRQTPVLSSWFESSMPGLYFVGIAAFPSCGPLFRFVAGTGAAARRVAQAVATGAGVSRSGRLSA
jgi:hypothetical protein